MKKIILLLFLSFSVSADPFDRAVNFVLAHEGGYCHDRGWESNYGICSKWYPKENIRDMTIERAKEIYRRDYWEPMLCHIMADTMYALVIFDCAVLFGRCAAGGMAKDCYDADDLLQRRIDATVELVKKDDNNLKYLKTWTRRIVDLAVEIKQ